MNKLCIIAITVGIAGCAAKPIVWDKPGGTQIAFAQDRYQCQLETEHSGKLRSRRSAAICRTGR